MYSRALRPSEINLGFRVQGVGFSRSRIDLERAWGLGLGVLQEQDLDQPLEVDPARSAAVIEHLSAKRFLCARVVIGEQAPGEVRVARREERKVRARHLALTNSCPIHVPSRSIPLGLFPMRSHFGALTSATSPACCRIPLASTRLRSHVRLQRTLLSYPCVPSWPMIRICFHSSLRAVQRFIRLRLGWPGVYRRRFQARAIAPFPGGFWPKPLESRLESTRD